MKRAAVVPLIWAAWLSVLCGVALLFGPLPIVLVMLASAILAALAFGLALWLLDAHRSANVEQPRALADGSYATTTAVAGFALIVLGAGFGMWLVLIGGGVIALGLGGLVRERVASRRALHHHRALHERRAR